MDTIISFFRNYVAWLTIPEFTITDVLEIVIIAYAFYHIILWIKDTRAWMLLRGALEQLGRKNILSSLASFDNQRSKNERYTEKSIQAIVKATYDMAKVKTGALIVVEKEIQCREYERTGIPIDSEISSQLIINIFEHNTPLHDGAVLVRDNRIVAATCYLPLSNNLQVSKELGTRHRAGLGISEVSDSLTIIVSEETGFVSLACDGRLYRKIDADTLQLRLFEASRRSPDDKKKKWWKGRRRHEKQDNN